MHFTEHASIATANFDEPATISSFKRVPFQSNSWRQHSSQVRLTEEKRNMVDLPPGKNLVESKWTFKHNEVLEEKITRYKARLVAQGYSQQHGVDYDEVFAPVAKFSSIRFVLAIANRQSIHQMEVKTAFLNGDLEEEIFMKQPKGFVDKKHPNMVCKLRKGLYGLK